MSAERRGWSWAGACFVLMLPIFTLALWLNVAGSAPGVRLSPTASRQVLAAALSLPLIPAAFIVGLVVARRWWWGVGGAVLGLLALGLVGGGALLTVGSPDFLFAPKWIRSEPSPSNHAVAHLYRDAFLACSWKLYLGAPNDLLLTAGESTACRTDTAPHVRWRSDGGAAIASGDGGFLSGEDY